MSWSEPSRRGALALGLAGLVSGCFRPMLAETGEAAALRGRIAMPNVRGRETYHLRRTLEERLGTPREPDYRLEVELAFRERGLAISQDASVTRRTIIATANWRLLRRGADAPVLSSREIAQAGYNETGALYATDVAARDIERRLSRDLAERISRDILARADTVAAAAP